MSDSIIVGAIVLVAAIYVGRRLFRQFTTKSASCGCGGCGGGCSGTQDENKVRSCCDK